MQPRELLLVASLLTTTPRALDMILSALAFVLTAATAAFARQSAHPVDSTFHPLPSLREQHALAERWAEARKELVPGLLKK